MAEATADRSAGRIDRIFFIATEDTEATEGVERTEYISICVYTYILLHHLVFSPRIETDSFDEDPCPHAAGTGRTGYADVSP